MINASVPQLVVSVESLAADDAAVVHSFVSIVNVLLEDGVEPEHLADGSFAAYYTDYYLAQVGNGGFAQFLWNGGRDPRVLSSVRDGLTRFGGEAHTAIFARYAAGWDALSPAAREEFCGRDLFGTNSLRDRLGEPDDDFFALNRTDPLTGRIAGWLRAHPDLLVLPRAELEEYVASRIAVIRARASGQA